MDIHGGGFDLRFPHHDNELAQSEVGWGWGGCLRWAGLAFPLEVQEVRMLVRCCLSRP